MKMVLTGLKCLEIRESDHVGRPPAGYVRVRVLCCAICRTDAKMWSEGHRDLVLPRVPGHEMVVVGEQQGRYVVWPGDCCGSCRYCRAGRENLCEAMQIAGFHRDGGFADRVIVPQSSLIPIPKTLQTVIACLAEPLGCVLHALEIGGIGVNDRVLIYGGGTLGLLTALAAKTVGARPVVIEKNPDKIRLAAGFLDKTKIVCLTNTDENAFDLAINACPDETAFKQGLTRLDKGGRFLFFSGLTKNRMLATGLLDRVHYREIILSGSYGLTRENMRRAVYLLENHQGALKHLIEAVVPPEKAPELMPRVLAGDGFKYVLDFKGSFVNTE